VENTKAGRASSMYETQREVEPRAKEIVLGGWGSPTLGLLVIMVFIHAGHRTERK
jgi:hypothetical protein